MPAASSLVLVDDEKGIDQAAELAVLPGALAGRGTGLTPPPPPPPPRVAVPCCASEKAGVAGRAASRRACTHLARFPAVAAARW